MSDFVHLHTHSDYSLLASTMTIDMIVNRCVETGMRHVALTDDGNLFGTLEFYKRCRTAGIKPIIGYDCYVAFGSRRQRDKSNGGLNYHRLVLLAKDARGYANLLRIASNAYIEGFYYKPRVDYELLEMHHEGLIAIAGGLNGDIGAPDTHQQC